MTRPKFDVNGGIAIAVTIILAGVSISQYFEIQEFREGNVIAES